MVWRTTSALMAVAFAICLPGSALCAVGVTSSSDVTFGANNMPYISRYGSVAYTLVDFADDFGVNAIADGGPAGSYGIAFNIGGSLFASVSAHAGLSNSLAYSWTGHYTTTVVGADGAGGSFEGTPFTISTHGSLGANNSLVVANPTITAGIDAFVKAEGHASASGCVYGCVNLSLKVGNGSGTDIPLAGYNSATNDAYFLGQTEHDALPHTFETDDKIFSATVNKTDFSGAVQNQEPSNGSLRYSSTQQLGDVSANLAAAVADAIGVPASVLKGEVLGFDYELLGVYVGIGLDVTHTIAITPELVTGYHFSDKVQTLDSLTNTWSAPTSYIEAKNDQVLTLRSLGTSDLSYVTQEYLLGEINSTFDFRATLQDTLRILAFNGYGIDEALFDKTNKLADLGSLGTISDRYYFNQSIATNLSTLRFGSIDGGALTKVIGFFGDGNDSLTYIKVLNYGSSCNERIHIACEIDPSFRPIVSHVRLDTATSGVVYSEDFALADALARTIEGLNGEQSDADLRARRLSALINNGNAAGGRLAGAAPGAPFQAGEFTLVAAVPEPSGWGIMLLGFGLIGGVTRRSKGGRSFA